jgi:hypothetical protein
MILHPGVIALLVSSALITFLACYASWHGIMILRRWDIASGSGLQLDLERRTYLISTILSYACAFQLFSLFLYVYTADGLAPLFVGAMCAAGTLYAGQYGYLVLMLKIITVVLAGLWLIMNHADNAAPDYPLIRKKYALLLVLAPLLLLEAVLQYSYLLGLNPAVITSCCGSLFSHDAKSVASELYGMRPALAKTLFFSGMALYLAWGAVVYRGSGKGGVLLSVLAGAVFLLSITAVLSFYSLYIYELPTHHCPFCILQREYWSVGYGVYGTVIGGVVAGLGVGLLSPYRKVPSLAGTLPAVQRRLTVMSMLCYGAFTLIVLYGMARSSLRL